MSALHKSECQSGDWQDADQNTNNTTFAPAESLSNQAKDYAATKAQFLLKGHALQRIYRPADDCTLYVVGKWGHSRVYAHWHDVQGFLIQVGGLSYGL